MNCKDYYKENSTSFMDVPCGHLQSKKLLFIILVKMNDRR
jgi:hypothetical protein